MYTTTENPLLKYDAEAVSVKMKCSLFEAYLFIFKTIEKDLSDDEFLAALRFVIETPTVFKEYANLAELLKVFAYQMRQRKDIGFVQELTKLKEQFIYTWLRNTKISKLFSFMFASPEKYYYLSLEFPSMLTTVRLEKCLDFAKTDISHTSSISLELLEKYFQLCSGQSAYIDTQKEEVSDVFHQTYVNIFNKRMTELELIFAKVSSGEIIFTRKQLLSFCERIVYFGKYSPSYLSDRVQKLKAGTANCLEKNIPLDTIEYLQEVEKLGLTDLAQIIREKILVSIIEEKDTVSLGL